ncbi:MAG: type II toxin-antitoxin system HicA family toxin [Candidatus Pacebacteria bacterium]|nr:type II toxin-antitoxin system HicA family toxin [Candidatus Paceibacterota bacterium]
MSKLKVLSGRSIEKMLRRFGFQTTSIRGSHLHMKYGQAIVTIPLHKEVSKGLLKGMYNDLSRVIPESDLREMFYTK